MTDAAIAVPEGGDASDSPAELEQSCMKKRKLNEVDFNLEEEEESRESEESEESEDNYYGDGGEDVDEDEDQDGDDDVEDPYDFTQEEYKRYNEQIRKSKGFHVEEFPNKRLAGIIKPIVKFGEGSAIFELVNKCSVPAIASYNYEHGTGYQVVKVVKLNVQIVGGFMFFMTIEAKDDANAAAADGDQSSRIFEAKVRCGIGHDIKVWYCGLKPTNY